MTHGESLRRELPRLLQLAIPVSLAHLAQSMMHLVDAAILGRVDTVALAAGSYGGFLFFVASAIGIGLMFGFDPLFAQAFGAGEPHRARAYLVQGRWLALIAGAVLGPTLLLLPWILPFLGVDAALLPILGRYLFYRVPSVPLYLLIVCTGSYLTAAGKPLWFLGAGLLANAVNALLALLLVFGGSGLPAWTGLLRAVPAMGAEGAAVATGIAMLVQLGAASWAARRIVHPPLARADGQEPSLGLGLRSSWKPQRAALMRAFSVGLPIGLHLVAEIGIFALCGALAAGFGAASLAAHQLILNFSSLVFTLAVGFGSAAAVRVGYAVGAGQSEQARGAGLLAIATGAALMTLAGLVLFAARHLLLGLFTSEAEVLAIAVPVAAVCAVYQLADGVQGIAAGALRGAGDTRLPFIAVFLGHYLLGLPTSLLLGRTLGMGVVGIWWGLCVGLSVVAVALLARFVWLTGRRIERLEKEAY